MVRKKCYVVMGDVKRIGFDTFKRQDMSIPLTKSSAVKQAKVERKGEKRRKKGKTFTYRSGLRIKNIKVEKIC